ncbi:hypothetical protein AWM68_17895 [Fictibacillus phosphorivorans]|uniref:Type II secretion system protein GspF domain-containing protein n=2 Tax=Fictibacillus phosphorivorans TaxID=1221500 RepID=A0A163S3E1_9BACL|nr:hypothetical protein AWM68_17895 [Fictibacillus phosphorivorans]
MIFKYIPYLVTTLSVFFSCLAGILVYSGLTSKAERVQNRIRFRANLSNHRQNFVENTKNSAAEDWLRKAQYPLGLNGVKYYLFLAGFTLFLTIYYVIIPILVNGGVGKLQFISAIAIFLLVAFAIPSNPFSLFVYLMKRVIDFHNAKKHAEVFMLYDLLINEIEMMSVSRINTYNVLRNIKPYFVVLDKPLTLLLSSWSSDEGPAVALDKFANQLQSKESQALIGVIKNLDNVERETALNHLRGMHSMFVKSQIENYRRKKKITTDLLGIPIKATHFLIILNFLVVIVTMVTVIMKNSRM